MQYEALLTIDIDAAQKDAVLYQEIVDDWVFGDNYEKICKIKKHKDWVGFSRSLYELYFFKAEDATAFKLKYDYALYRPEQV
jgi:hypothetical protein